MRSASPKIKSGRSNVGSSKVLEVSDLKEALGGIKVLDFWRVLFNATVEGISVHSAGGEILFANRKVLEIYNKSEQDLTGYGCTQVFHVDDSPCPHDYVLATGSAINVEEKIVIGGRIYSLMLRPIANEIGETAGFIRILQDVTSQEMAREQLLRAEQLATLGQMVNGIAHDIGTPLNIISGYSEYLLMRTKPDSQGYNELSTILQQTRRIAEFIRQMLDLARPAQDRADAIELKQFFADSIDILSHQLRKADVKASVLCKECPILVYADAPRLRQAFFNLLLNACQETGAGGRMEIEVDYSPDDPGIMMIAIIGIDKSGKGIDFSESFSGFLSSGVIGGAVGLGLSLAKDILNRFGARVGAGASGERGVPLVVYMPKTANR